MRAVASGAGAEEDEDGGGAGFEDIAVDGAEGTCAVAAVPPVVALGAAVDALAPSVPDAREGGSRCAQPAAESTENPMPSTNRIEVIRSGKRVALVCRVMTGTFLADSCGLVKKP